MTLKDVQDISLHILKHFHKFCEENGLRYSLAFGTLIGAIRHEGFIPWDDDVDLYMPRADYERLCDIYQDSEDFALFCPKRRNHYLPYTRICEMRQTYVKCDSPQFAKQTGVWIDVFPMDAAADDYRQYLKKALPLWDDYHFIGHDYRRVEARLQTPVGKWLKPLFKAFIKSGFAKINPSFVRMRDETSIVDAVENYDDKVKTLFDATSNHVAELVQFTNTYSIVRNYHPKKMFEEYVLKKFETEQFYCIADYDENLRTIYGDYMQLPPEEERLPGHKMNNYLWK